MADFAVIMCVAFDRRASADGLRKFKNCIARCPFVETTTEVSGTYDLIVRGSCSSLAEYGEHMELIRGPIAEFATRLEANFVGKTVEQNLEGGEIDALWLPIEGGHKRVQAKMIDKVEAEGDYMRVFVGEWNCLLRETMRRLSRRLGDARFIKLHRSFLVRIEFIEQLIHMDHRWRARLRDGAQVNIAKSHAQRVLQLVTAESSTPSVSPSQHTGLIGKSGDVNEMATATSA